MRRLRCVVLVSGVLVVGCGAEDDTTSAPGTTLPSGGTLTVGDSTGMEGGSEGAMTAGDGDSGDGDGTSSGDGDGTSSGDGDGTSQGDGDGTSGDGSAGDGSAGDGDGTSGDGDGTSGDGDGCGAAGSIVCVGNDAHTCDGMGGETITPCPLTCADGLGCVVCIPGEMQCVDAMTSEVCASDGMSWLPNNICDPTQGTTCDMGGTGDCTGPCAPSQLGNSYIGCDYYPVVMAGNWESSPFPFNFAVIVSNVGTTDANVTSTRGTTTVDTRVVAANTAEVIILPWVAELVVGDINDPNNTLLVPDGAYRVRSDQPVTVYQYNPLEYQLPVSCVNGGQIFPSSPCFAYANDASLLLPVNVWGMDYFVVSRNHWVPSQATQFDLPGQYTVVASEDGTTVQMFGSPTSGFTSAGAGVNSDGSGMLVMNAGDALEVFTERNGSSEFNTSDLTGVHIISDKPIEVFGGHKCTNVPANVTACDRLEEAILPFDAVGRTYIIAAPQNTVGGQNQQIVRITATQPGTTLTYNPPVAGAPTSIANVGEYVELAPNPASYELTSNNKILVSQYMRGQGSAFDPPGDPSMAMAVPVEQYRADYLIHAPLSFDQNWVNITAPTGTAITVDGVAVGGFTPVASGFDLARVQLVDNATGTHSIASTGAPFGVSVYGYGEFTSYWYPGGLDLNLVPQ